MKAKFWDNVNFLDKKTWDFEIKHQQSKIKSLNFGITSWDLLLDKVKTMRKMLTALDLKFKLFRSEFKALKLKNK